MNVLRSYLQNTLLMFALLLHICIRPPHARHKGSSVRTATRLQVRRLKNLVRFQIGTSNSSLLLREQIRDAAHLTLIQ
jgi:hypothetical protein